jgi:hypothetical protein
MERRRKYDSLVELAVGEDTESGEGCMILGGRSSRIERCLVDAERSAVNLGIELDGAGSAATALRDSVASSWSSGEATALRKSDLGRSAPVRSSLN